MHDTTSDFVEYFPAAHVVQVVAPVPMPALVMEQAAQSVKAAMFAAGEYLPAEHGVHVVAADATSTR